MLIKTRLRLPRGFVTVGRASLSWGWIRAKYVCTNEPYGLGVCWFGYWRSFRFRFLLLFWHFSLSWVVPNKPAHPAAPSTPPTCARLAP